MSMTLLQFDFPYSGPWGAAMTAALEPLAKDIAGENGLVWKVWTENETARRAGGIYLFDDFGAADLYRRKHEQRLTAFGIEGIVAKSFAVNAPLSALTRAPL